MSLAGHRLEAVTHVIRAATAELHLALDEMQHLTSEDRAPAGIGAIPYENVGDLSTRQLEVLSLMAEASTNSAIARRLSLTEKTVEAHVSSIFSILELPTAGDYHRRVLAVLAYLGSPPSARPGRTDGQPHWAATTRRFGRCT